MPQLIHILENIPFKIIPHGDLTNVEVHGIAYDSRKVHAGDIFVALTGGNTDGHRYIPSAIERGAAVIVGSKDIGTLSVPYLQVENARQAMAYLSAAFYGFPARSMHVIGVTGTDGKTTTSNLIYQILKAAGYQAGIISTVNAVIGSEVLDTGFHVTTPEAPEIQSYLAKMRDAGLTHVVLETTSHGLAQHRTDFCEVDVAVVTNITHEHLDYHGSYAEYRQAKARLFESLPFTSEKPFGNPRMAVLNADDQSFEFLRNIVNTACRTYGITHPNPIDLRAEAVKYEKGSLQFFASSERYHFPITANLIGQFNVSNCLAAACATLYGSDVPVEAIQMGVKQMQGVPGRMEVIDLGQPFTAIVDFAHTPNALRVALLAARELTEGRVIAVFGSAGLRDREKRRMMPQVAVELADISIITAEDPRTESLEQILDEMVHAAEDQGGILGKTVFAVADRGDAIRQGVQMARPGDVLISCGKGHEQSMCFGEIEYPWDDRIAMRSALSAYLGIEGPAMPHLPTSEK